MCRIALCTPPSLRREGPIPSSALLDTISRNRLAFGIAHLRLRSSLAEMGFEKGIGIALDFYTLSYVADLMEFSVFILSDHWSFHPKSQG